ncbi:MAG: DUF99 family protein [Candidatus Hodarchaeota archaeon]
MPVRVSKKGIRVLGISESFQKEKSKKSVLAGVVIRADRIVDGFAATTITLGGFDATDGIVRIFDIVDRTDINVLMLNGVIIAWFNVIDLNLLHERLSIPIIAVTYEESQESLKKYFREYFPKSWERKMEVYVRNGEREHILLRTGHEVLVRYLGMGKREAKSLLDKFTIQGSIPEPLRVSRLLARSLMKEPPAL